MSVYTTNINKEGIYSLKITGTITGSTSSADATFTLTVKDICSISTISSALIPDYSYDISEGTTNTITSLAWTQSEGTCATAITYALSTSDSSALPNFVTISSALLK